MIPIQELLNRIRWDDDRVSLSRIARTLDSLGYPPHPYRRSEARDLARREDRARLVRIGVAGAFICPASGLLLAWPASELLGLSEIQSAQLLVFAALPPAVLNFMLAERYNIEPHKVAAVVLLGNLAVWVAADGEGEKVEWDAKNLKVTNLASLKTPGVADLIKPNYPEGYRLD